MASQSNTNTSPIQRPSSVSSSHSVPPSAQHPLSSSATRTPTSVSPSSPIPSTSPQSHAPPQQSVLTSTSVSLFSASQVAHAPNVTSQPLPSTGITNTPRPEAGHDPVPPRVTIPVTTAIAVLFVLWFLLYSYRRYRRRRQLEEAPLPAKRTPVILERHRTQSMYRFEVSHTSNNSIMAPITSPPHNSGTSSYLPFPSKGSNISDGSYTHPSLPLYASISALSLERQPSTVSLPTLPYEFAKDTSAVTLHSLTGNYPIGPLEFLQQPFTPPYARRDPRPAARHSRPGSIASVASRHSTYSLATMRSGQRTGSGSALRGPPHKNNMNIVLPQPLGPKSHPVSTFNGEPSSVHPQYMDSMGGTSPQSWNGHGELRHRSNASKDRMREEREEGNSGSYQTSSSLATMSYPRIPHSQSAPAVIDWRHKGSALMGLPDYNVNMVMNAPPVPPLPQHFQMPPAESCASGTSSRNPSMFLAPYAAMVNLQRPSSPRSSLHKRVSLPGPDLELEKLERMPQLEEPVSQTRLLPDSVFTDPDGELENTTIQSGRSSPSFTHPTLHPLFQQT